MRDSILQRIETGTVSFKKIGVVADITALMGTNEGRARIAHQYAPGVFLHLVGESAAPAQDRPGKFSQVKTRRWGLLILTRSVNDPTGAAAAAQTDDLVDELDDALLGFTPTGAHTALQASRNAGQVRRWASDLYFYSAHYEAEKRICKTGA